MSVRVVWYWFAKNRYEASVLESRVNKQNKRWQHLHPSIQEIWATHEHRGAHPARPPRSQGVHHAAHRPSTVRNPHPSRKKKLDEAARSSRQNLFRRGALTTRCEEGEHTIATIAPSLIYVAMTRARWCVSYFSFSLPPSLHSLANPHTNQKLIPHRRCILAAPACRSEFRTKEGQDGHCRGENPRRAFLMAKHLACNHERRQR